jgi:hypothetical protein
VPSSISRCVTRSSSVVGSSEYMPGVSSTSQVVSPTRMPARATSTDVPGKFETVA